MAGEVSLLNRAQSHYTEELPKPHEKETRSGGGRESDAGRMKGDAQVTETGKRKETHNKVHVGTSRKNKLRAKIGGGGAKRTTGKSGEGP